MDRAPLRPRVSQLFAGHAVRRTRVAVEQELITAVDSGGVAPLETVRAATRGASYADYLSFEPGGQVELSLPCAVDAHVAAARLREDVSTLRDDLARVGVRVEAVPVDPRPEADVALQLTSPRYLAMQAHFDTIGPAGRRMMRRTASTQVCLDWWPGRAGLEQWRVLNLVAPFLAAAFARSQGPDGRLATWLAVDPARTAFDDRLLHGDDPVAAYVDFAAGATAFVAPEEHLTTLFPPVRPRCRYLEVRFLDVQEEQAVGPIAELLAAILYDADRRRDCLRRLEAETRLLADWWHAAAFGGQDVIALGVDLVGRHGLEVAA